MAETPTNITYLPIAIPPRRYLGVRASGPHPPVCHSPQMNVVHALTTIPDLRSHSVRHYPLFSLLAIVLRAAMHPPACGGGTGGVSRIAVRTMPAGERERVLALLEACQLAGTVISADAGLVHPRGDLSLYLGQARAWPGAQ